MTPVNSSILKQLAEMIPPRWRVQVETFALGVAAVLLYIHLITGPMAAVQTAVAEQSKQITSLQALQTDVSNVETLQAVQGQKLDDLKGTVGDVNRKLDVLLTHNAGK